METHNVSSLQQETTTADGPKIVSLAKKDSATLSYYAIPAGAPKSGAITQKFGHIPQ